MPFTGRWPESQQKAPRGGDKVWMEGRSKSYVCIQCGIALCTSAAKRVPAVGSLDLQVMEHEL